MNHEINYGDIILLKKSQSSEYIVTSVSFFLGKTFGLSYLDDPKRIKKNGILVTDGETSLAVNTLFYSPKSLQKRGNYALASTLNSKPVRILPNNTCFIGKNTGIVFRPLTLKKEIVVVFSEKPIKNFNNKVIKIMGYESYLNAKIL